MIQPCAWPPRFDPTKLGNTVQTKVSSKKLLKKHQSQLLWNIYCICVDTYFTKLTNLILGHKWLAIDGPWNMSQRGNHHRHMSSFPLNGKTVQMHWEIFINVTILYDVLNIDEPIATKNTFYQICLNIIVAGCKPSVAPQKR